MSLQGNGEVTRGLEMGLLRPSDRARLDRAWQRFIQLKRQRIEADRKGLYGTAATLEREEKAAHIDVAFIYHELDE
jgi:hypothetical protein